MRFYFRLLLMMLAIGPAAAQLPVDPRIRILMYSPDQVVDLDVNLGFAAVVELSPDERADSVIVGNTTGWQVTTTRRGDSIVVKPLTGAESTNMIVVTGTRRYVFLLRPSDGVGTSLFAIRFSYPDGEAPGTAGHPVATFKFSGTKDLFPAAMHDDGKRTIVTWGPNSQLPAVYTVTRDKREAIVNGRMIDNDYIIETTSQRFIFRLGNAKAVATRRVTEPK